jgi:hypothetical protein
MVTLITGNPSACGVSKMIRYSLELPPELTVTILFFRGLMGVVALPLARVTPLHVTLPELVYSVSSREEIVWDRKIFFTMSNWK